MHCRADYWVAKWELKTKLRLQILFHPLLSCQVTRVFCSIINMAPLWLEKVCHITAGGCWVDVESAVWPPSIIASIVARGRWGVALCGRWARTNRERWARPDLKTLPQLLPPLAAAPTSHTCPCPSHTLSSHTFAISSSHTCH